MNSSGGAGGHTHDTRLIASDLLKMSSVLSHAVSKLVRTYFTDVQGLPSAHLVYAETNGMEPAQGTTECLSVPRSYLLPKLG